MAKKSVGKLKWNTKKYLNSPKESRKWEQRNKRTNGTQRKQRRK